MCVVESPELNSLLKEFVNYISIMSGKEQKSFKMWELKETQAQQLYIKRQDLERLRREKEEKRLHKLEVQRLDGKKK